MVAESLLITGQFFTAEIQQGQSQLSGKFLQGRLVALEVDAGQRLDRFKLYAVRL